MRIHWCPNKHSAQFSQGDLASKPKSITQVRDKATRAALKRLSDLFDNSQADNPAAGVDHQGDELERGGGRGEAR